MWKFRGQNFLMRGRSFVPQLFRCGVRCFVCGGRYFGSEVRVGSCGVCVRVGGVGVVCGFVGQDFLMSSVVWKFVG